MQTAKQQSPSASRRIALRGIPCNTPECNALKILRAEDAQSVDASPTRSDNAVELQWLTLEACDIS